MSTSKPSAADLKAMLGCIDVAALIPDVYAEYRQPLADALAFFLEQLAPERLMAILAEQAAMPLDCVAADRLVTLMHHCPTLHKLGQVVARHRELDAEFRTHLQRLECTPPRIHIDEITDIIERELEPDALRQLTLEERALAEASVAVVVPGVWHDPHRKETIDVVLKVLKPGIEQVLDEELALLGKVGTLLDERMHGCELPPLGYADTFEEVRNLLRHEIRLEAEQTNLRRAGDLYAGFGNVDVPFPLEPLYSPCITGMSRLDGVKVTEHQSFPESRHQQLAATIVEALLAQTVFASGSDAMFHADPHAGNLLDALDVAFVRLTRVDGRPRVTRLVDPANHDALLVAIVERVVGHATSLNQRLNQLAIRATTPNGSTDAPSSYVFTPTHPGAFHDQSPHAA